MHVAEVADAAFDAEVASDDHAAFDGHSFFAFLESESKSNGADLLLEVLFAGHRADVHILVDYAVEEGVVEVV